MVGYSCLHGPRGGRGSAVLPGYHSGETGLLRWVEPQLVDVPQETEESAHLLTADGGGQVCDLDDISPRDPTHCTERYRCSKIFQPYLNAVNIWFSARFTPNIQTDSFASPWLGLIRTSETHYRPLQDGSVTAPNSEHCYAPRYSSIWY